VVDQPQHGADDAADGADLASVAIARGRQRVVVAEQFVGAVDEIDVQRVLLGRSIMMPTPQSKR
jgi:hypothetical protein